MASSSHDQPRGEGRRPPVDVAYVVGDRDSIDAVGALYAEREGVSPDQAQLWADQVLERLRGGLGQLITATVDGQMVGYGLVDWMSREPAPGGFYLMGLVVHPSFRRLGIGREITRRRLEWVAARTGTVFYIANASNQATIDLHADFGFREVGRASEIAGVTFAGQLGILFELSVDAE